MLEKAIGITLSMAFMAFLAFKYIKHMKEDGFEWTNRMRFIGGLYIAIILVLLFHFIKLLIHG